MKYLASPLILIASLAANEAFAFDNPPTERDAQICYGYAMVGFDSVINSRLGVPAEFALGLARNNPVAVADDDRYSINVLKIVLNAYLWQDNPHDYAVQVFYHCAQGQETNLGASLD